MARIPRGDTSSPRETSKSLSDGIQPSSTARRTEDTLLTAPRPTKTHTLPKHSDTSSQSTPSIVSLEGPLTTASPLPDITSSSINWGPAITAPSLKSPLPTQSPSPDSNLASNKFTDGSRKAVIAATTIGGTLILIFLIYALWRRRQGASYAEIVTFRRHSGTVVLGSPREPHLTALPIYRESRYSVRSSKIGSTPSLPKNGRYPSGIPSSAAQRFYKQNPWLQDVKRGDEPPTPVMTEHQRAQYAELPALAMTRANDVQSSKEALNESKGDDDKVQPSISIRPSSSANADDISQSGSPKELTPDRWSWTNSQAPPTPRLYAPSLSSRRSSVPRFRKVKSWVRHQADRQTLRIEEERGPTTSNARLAFKNQASKPNLAPKITRKLSKKSLKRDSSLVIQSNAEQHPLPEPAKGKDTWQ